MSLSRTTVKLVLACGVFTFSFLAASQALGSEYVSLSGIPKLEEAAQDGDLGGYLNTIYIMLVSLGALLAVIKIAIAGFKIAGSDIVTERGDAKKDIQGALIGLAILLTPFLILYTIYPGLINLNVLQLDPIKNKSDMGMPSAKTVSPLRDAGDYCFVKDGTVHKFSSLDACMNSSSRGSAVCGGAATCENIAAQSHQTAVSNEFEEVFRSPNKATLFEGKTPSQKRAIIADLRAQCLSSGGKNITNASPDSMDGQVVCVK